MCDPTHSVSPLHPSPFPLPVSHHFFSSLALPLNHPISSLTPFLHDIPTHSIHISLPSALYLVSHPISIPCCLSQVSSPLHIHPPHFLLSLPPSFDNPSFPFLVFPLPLTPLPLPLPSHTTEIK